MTDWNRCNICRSRGGLLSENHSHYLCEARQKRGNPTPKIRVKKITKAMRKAHEKENDKLIARGYIFLTKP